MHLTFVLRLYVVYKGTAFQYNYKHLISIAVMSVVSNVINCALTIFLYETDEKLFYGKMSYAMHCDATDHQPTHSVITV